MEIKNELQLRDLFKEIDELRILKRDGFKGIIPPIVFTISGTTLAQNSINYSAPFFYADRNYEVIEFKERHEVAGTDAGAVTIMLNKVPDATAPASGTNVLTATLSLKTTANTWQSGTITSSLPDFVLSSGDALSVISSGTLTSLQGITVAIILKAL